MARRVGVPRWPRVSETRSQSRSTSHTVRIQLGAKLYFSMMGNSDTPTHANCNRQFRHTDVRGFLVWTAALCALLGRTAGHTIEISMKTTSLLGFIPPGIPGTALPELQRCHGRGNLTAQPSTMRIYPSYKCNDGCRSPWIQTRDSVIHDVLSLPQHAPFVNQGYGARSPCCCSCRSRT